MRSVILSLFTILTFAIMPACSSGQEQKVPTTDLVFIGTYTDAGTSKGIYRAEFDPKTGKFSQPVLAAKVDGPSFLAIHPNGRFLYSVNELGKFGSQKTGAITAFSLDP